MLVLSRQLDETIIIGDEIEISIVDIRGDKVRVGITAPSRIAVHRKEVYEAIRSENEQAARGVRGIGKDDLAAIIGGSPGGFAAGPSRARSLRRSPPLTAAAPPGSGIPPRPQGIVAGSKPSGTRLAIPRTP